MSDPNRGRSTTVTFLVLDPVIDDVSPFDRAGADKSNEHVENRISRKRHLPGYNIIRQISTGPLSYLSDFSPKGGADYDNGTVSGHVIQGFRTDLLWVGDINEETGQRGATGLGVASNDVAIDTSDCVSGFWWEIAIVDDFLLFFGYG